MLSIFIDFLLIDYLFADKEKDIQAATEKLRVKLEESYKKQEDLANDISNLKVCVLLKLHNFVKKQ